MFNLVMKRKYIFFVICFFCFLIADVIDGFYPNNLLSVSNFGIIVSSITKVIKHTTLLVIVGLLILNSIVLIRQNGITVKTLLMAIFTCLIISLVGLFLIFMYYQSYHFIKTETLMKNSVRDIQKKIEITLSRNNLTIEERSRLSHKYAAIKFINFGEIVDYTSLNGEITKFAPNVKDINGRVDALISYYINQHEKEIYLKQLLYFLIVASLVTFFSVYVKLDGLHGKRGGGSH